MNRFTTAVLFLTAGAFAGAQTTVTYTSPAGAINCHLSQPTFDLQYYSNLVEKSTPPYPNPLQPNNFQMPAEPNQPNAVSDGRCPIMDGFVSPDSLYTASLENGGDTVFQLRTSAGQVIEGNNLVWTYPDHYPVVGESVTFMLDATLTTICSPECTNASGTFHMEGQWAFQWWSYVTRNGRTGGSTTHIVKRWTNTSDVVITINEQSGPSILD